MLVPMIDRSVGWLRKMPACVIVWYFVSVLLCVLLSVCGSSHWEWSGTQWSSSVRTFWTLSLGRQSHSPEALAGTTIPDRLLPSDNEQEPITYQQHRLIRQSVKLSTHIDRKSVCAVCWGFGYQEDLGARTFGEPKPGNTEWCHQVLFDPGTSPLTPQFLFDKSYCQDCFCLATSSAMGRGCWGPSHNAPSTSLLFTFMSHNNF